MAMTHAAFPAHLIDSARALLDACRAAGWMLATAESCTGGMIAGCLTEIPGSSDVVDRGFVTYSNEAKTGMLDVPADLIETHGAVSEAVARSMASGALARSRAQVSIAVTGVAGPSGGTEAKPVGLVHLACARGDGLVRHREIRLGEIGRGPIRVATVAEAFDLAQEVIGLATPAGERPG